MPEGEQSVASAAPVIARRLEKIAFQKTFYDTKVSSSLTTLWLMAYRSPWASSTEPRAPTGSLSRYHWDEARGNKKEMFKP